jgi:hypothetical protein
MMLVCTTDAVTVEMTLANHFFKSARAHDSVSHVERTVDALHTSWIQRRDRPWLALVAVPLAMNASGLMQLWWLWIPLLLGAAACTPAWRWSWALTLQLAIVGTEWAYVGATSLAQWPAQRAVVAATWVYVALLLAGAANLNRMYQQYRQWKRGV